MDARDVIIKPILTEKSYDGIEPKTLKNGKTTARKYVFQVAKKSNKTEIKLAVESLFGVKVDSVNTANCRGKLKRMGKHEGYTPSFKKAFVTLKHDSKEIEFFKTLS